ncbi:RNA polymerase, sigma-24 subunit, ECF subfamily [Verrucomicrobia bacterium]|nr:RNA polymerase, sigma-24 subunit, ECF subfamily [Verrucomicrobiota bacterium]
MMSKLSLATLSHWCSGVDEEAMCRVAQYNDHEAFARLVRRWEEPVRRLCVRMTGDAYRAEDLKQETFLRLFEKRKDYQPRSHFSTYLWRVALNLCYDELRRRERRREFLREDPTGGEGAMEGQAAEGPSPDLRTVQLEEGELVRQALLQLPEIYRTVLVLRHYQGLKLARIAEILEIPEGTVNSRMAEALARLSRILQPRLNPLPNATGQFPPPTVHPKFVL